MPFILSAQRDHANFEEFNDSWKRYRDYLAAAESRCPPSAFALASSDWWYVGDRADAPHDSRLLELGIRDLGAETWDNDAGTEIRIVLKSAYEGILRLHYPQVYRYSMTLPDVANGVHDDWRYDEFAITDSGRILHTIEWARGAVWEIEASDLIHEYIPPLAPLSILPGSIPCSP